MCAPSSVGAIEPVGMTNASTTNARKMKARMNATRIDSTVSLTLPSWCGCAGGCAGVATESCGAGDGAAGRAAGSAGMAVCYAVRGPEGRGEKSAAGLEAGGAGGRAAFPGRRNGGGAELVPQGTHLLAAERPVLARSHDAEEPVALAEGRDGAPLARCLTLLPRTKLGTRPGGEGEDRHGRPVANKYQ